MTYPLLTMLSTTQFMTSSTWMPTVPPSAPPSPLQNLFLTPRPPSCVLSATPRCTATPVHPLPLYQPPVSPRRPLSPLPSLLSPIREKVVSIQPQLYPPPVLWTPRPPSPLIQSSSPLNSTSALCGCLSISTTGSHRDGNQGLTNRVYGLWLKSSTPQNL